MPKSKQKYYAVRVGRGGPQVYTTWEECSKQVNRYPQSRFKSFSSLAEAQEWIKPSSPSTQSSLTSFNRPHIQAPISPTTDTDTTISTAPGPFPLPPSGQAGKQQVTEEPGITLSPEQTRVLSMVKSGRNVFFTGSAGTGKSVLLRQIIGWARERGEGKLGVTASTGMAAVNIGGVTLHSWAGIGLGNEQAKHYVNTIRYGPEKTYKRWLDVQILIIDEVSMIDAGLFDKLEQVARGVRESSRPFGGIQLVLSGDFFQLPPVDLVSKHVKFAFEAHSWDLCVDFVVTLIQVFRQKEQSFVTLLNEMRFGTLSSQNKSRLKALSREVQYTDSVEPTELFPTKKEVQSANETRLARLNGPKHMFNAIDHGGRDDRGRDVSPQHAKTQLDRCVLAPDSMTLKVGAQVMLIKNIEQGVLVNGSVGRVVDFFTCKEAKNKHHIEVALSPRDREENPRTGEVRIAEPLWQNQTKWPVVEFPNGRKRLLPPHEFTIDNVTGTTQAMRLQVPLILAWAISIHKAQGQTLQRVRVNLAKIFEKGQAYVALSRATSLQTLQVLNFDPIRVMVHDTVRQWHELNAEREGKAKTSMGLMDYEQAISDCAHVVSRSE